MDWTPTMSLPWGAGIGAAAEPLATANGPFMGPDPHSEARKANLAAYQFQQALLFSQRLSPTVGQPGGESWGPLPQLPGDSFQSAPLLPSLSSPTTVGSTTSIISTEPHSGGELQVGEPPPAEPQVGDFPPAELAVGPASPLPEGRRKKFKRARVVKEVKETKTGPADNEAQEGPLHREREQMGTSVRRFVARMQDVQGIRKFSEWKGSVVDSIVGTFLTQNVSDHLSSSAYMNIASRWPTSPDTPPVPEDNQSPLNCTTELHPEAKKIHGQPSDCQPGIELDTSAARVFASPSSPFGLSCAPEDDRSPKTPIWDGSKAKSPSAFLSDANETVGPFEQGGAEGEVNWQGFAGQAGWEPRIWDIEEAGGVAVTGLAVDAQPTRETCPPEAVPRGKERPPFYEDGVDWEGVRVAGVAEIADAIKERGMHLMLAGRIKSFLEKVKDEHGRIDLEWLRTAPADSAREYLRGLHGLGTKSTECILLLCLHQPAFPVDTNVGRICVRLGWVPLEPLDEELQLHLLDQYPIQQRLQEFLWRRLSHLGQRELYELHYQLITFGKVFCTKRQPNCLACPMRAECKHYASAKSHKEQRLAAPDPCPTPDQPTPQPPFPSPVPDSPPPPKRLEASAPPKPTHSEYSPLLPRRPIPQVGHEMRNGTMERKGHGASHSWAVLRATGPCCRAWYTEVRAAGLRFRNPGQATAASLDSKGVEILIANVVEGLSLLRDLRTVLASNWFRSVSAVLATKPLPPVQPTSSPGSKAIGGLPAGSLNPSTPARPLLHLQAAQKAPDVPLPRLRQSFPGPPHVGPVSKVRATAFYTLFAAAGQNQLDSTGTQSQKGRPSYPVRPHASRLVTVLGRHLEGQYGARMPTGLGSMVTLSPQKVPVSPSAPGGGKLGARHLVELSVRAELALARLASLLAMQQALGLPSRLSPPVLEVTPASPQPRVHGTLPNLKSPLAIEGVNYVRAGVAASQKEAPPTGLPRSTNPPTISSVAPSPSVAALLRAAFATHPPKRPPTAAPQSEPMSDGQSGPIVPYRPFPVDPRSTLPGKPLLLPTPSFRQGFRPDQPGVTGLPDLNVPLASPDEETARGLRETVKGAALDARKRGIGRKKRVPTVFWALPLERPEKLRTLRHAVRLPEDHPLLRQFPRREEDDPCPYFAVLWPASLVPAFPPPLPDLNEAPLEPVTPPLGDNQAAAASDVVAEPVYPKAGNAPAGNVDVSMVLADLLDEQRVADVTNVVNVGEEHERAGTDTRSRAEPSPAGDVALPASCKEPEARTETLAALGIVLTVPTARSVFLESPATASTPEPSGPSDPPVEAPREVTCYHLIDTAPNGEVEKSAAARRLCAPSERSPESMVIRRQRSVLPIRGRTWRRLVEREAGFVPGVGTRPGTLREWSVKRGPEETGLVIQTRGKKRRLEASAAGVDGSALDGAVRLELVLRKVPRKMRTRLEFLLPGGPGPTLNLTRGKCEPHQSGMELTSEKGIAVTKEAVVGGLCLVKQEKNVCEKLPVPGWALGKSQSRDRVVGSKWKPGESNRKPLDPGAVKCPAGDGNARGPLHGLKRVRSEVRKEGESMDDCPAEPQQLGLCNFTRETAGPHTPVLELVNCHVIAPGADARSAGVSAGADERPPTALLTAPSPLGVLIPPPYTGPYLPAGDSLAADSSPCQEAAYSAWTNNGAKGSGSKGLALVPQPAEFLEAPVALRAALAPSGLLSTTRTSTAGEPNASHVSNSDPSVADVTPQEDDATPPVCCPATPEKIRPNRPQMTPSPQKAAQAARVMSELGTVEDGIPEESPRGKGRTEASPCKCSTCCCRDEGTVFVTLLVPSRTAVGGRFPLNGTYFQTNELFADHATSHRPLTATAADFAGLPQCTVLFGTGAGNMFKACSLEAVQEVFQHGYICVRGFDVTRRMPKPLSTRLHAGTAAKKQRGPVAKI